MIAVAWTSAFKRAYKRYAKSRPELNADIAAALKKLHEDPSHPSLDTHMLHGKQKGLWSCTVSYDCRIIFVYKQIKLADKSMARQILLLNMGTHDEVY
jgi:mRNA interferase YafQ